MKTTLVEVLPVPVFTVLMGLPTASKVVLRFASGLPFTKATEVAREAAKTGFRALVVDANGVVAMTIDPEARPVLDTTATQLPADEVTL